MPFADGMLDTIAATGLETGLQTPPECPGEQRFPVVPKSNAVNPSILLPKDSLAMESQPAQILVIDDIPANLILLADILTAQGYKVRPASDVQLALRSVAVEQPDLILLDVKMPGMDGYEVCRLLKADPKHREIPVIFISALNETADKIKGFEAGALDYITKPFEPTEVLARVQTHLRLHMLQLHMEELVRQRARELTSTNADLITEIEEHAQTEEKLRQTNRSLTMLSTCNQALIHAEDEHSLLQKICTIIREIGGYAMACIGFAGQDEEKTIHMVAYSGCTGVCLRENLTLSWGETTAGRNPMGTAIRTGKPVICADLTNDAGFNIWCPDAADKNCRFVLALPLFADLQVLGAMCILSEKAGDRSPEETQLLLELAADLAYGIKALRANKERLQTAGELAHKKARLQSIIRSSPTGIAIIADRVFIEVNKRLCDMLGYEEHELVGQNTLLIYQDAEEFKQVDSRVVTELGQKDTASIETRFRCKDGRLIDVLLNWTRITPVADDGADGSLAGDPGKRQGDDKELNFTILDISERKRMERALRDSEVRYRTIFDNTGTAMLIVEEDTLIVLANAEFADLVGVSREELEGKASWTRFVAPDSLEQMLAYHRMRRVNPAEAPKRYEARLKNVLGQLIEVFITVVMIPGTTRSVASIIDITEQKRLENKTRQSQKMEAIGVLAGGIAHDFNNILGAIMGYTELALTKNTLDSNVRRYLERTYQAGERAKDLVQQILTFSRQTEQELKPVPVSLIAKEVLKLLRSTLPATIEIQQDISSSFQSDIVLADPTQIHQVLLNLCTNAAHAMRTKGGVLSVKVAEIQTSATMIHDTPDLQFGPYVMLSVSDTGHGMDKATSERIFEPYFTTKVQGEGTGLGLSVVIGIVKKFKGAITVDSELDQGTIFRVYLPRLQTQLQEPAADQEALPLGNEHILFVDDEPILAELGREVLESLGYRVTAITSSLQALEAFQQTPERFDLLFTDMTMPKMTGIELTRQCKKIRPHLPVLLGSGHSELIDEQTVTETGIAHFLVKPYSIDQIAHTLRQIFDQNIATPTPPRSSRV